MSFLHLRIERIEPGASYEGKLYDLDVVGRTASGRDVRVFDVEADLGRRLEPGRDVELVVGDSFPADLRAGEGGAWSGRVEASRWEATPGEVPGGREELYDGAWLRVATADGSVLLDADELDGDVAEGDVVSWTPGRFDLYAVVGQ